MKTTTHTRIVGLIALIVALLSLTINAQCTQAWLIEGFENGNLCACSQPPSYCNELNESKEVSLKEPLINFADLRIFGMRKSFNGLVASHHSKNAFKYLPTAKFWYRDKDLDGLGDPFNVKIDQVKPEGYTANALDDDDDKPFVSTSVVKEITESVHRTKL